MTTLQVVVGNQSIDLSKGFTERCGWALTLWHPEPLTYWPTLGHSYHTGEAGLDPRSLYLEQPGGHSGEMETFRLRKSLEAPGSQALRGLCLDEDRIAGSEVRAQVQDPLLPSSLLFPISQTNGHFRVVRRAWQRGFG